MQCPKFSACSVHVGTSHGENSILLSKKRVLEEEAVEQEVEVDVEVIGMGEEEVNTAGVVLVVVKVEDRVGVKGVVQPVQVLQDANLTIVICSGLRQQLMFM